MEVTWTSYYVLCLDDLTMPDAKLSSDSGGYREGDPETNASMHAFSRLSLYAI